jgi:hypothetical protein
MSSRRGVSKGVSLKARIVYALLIALAAQAASAACVNKYISQKEGSKYILTILTGKLSYQEAYDLAQAVNSHAAPPTEWVDEKGRTISKQIGDLKVVRPMPVSCDGKPSGVVLTTGFMAGRPLSGKIYIKFDDKNTVALDEQDR